MTISDLQLTCNELNFLLRRKYKNARNGVHYVLASTVSRDKFGVPTVNRDADIIEWRLEDIEKPTQEDIERLLDLFGDEIETNVFEPMEIEEAATVEDIGI